LMGERRARVRVKIQVTVTLVGQGETIQAEITDLSASGLMVKGTFDFLEGAKIQLFFTAPGHPAPLDIVGTVRRSEPTMLGVSFDEVGESQLAALEAVVSRHLLSIPLE